jgi:hypothetical protein
MVNVALALLPTESVTVRLKLGVPVAVGAPLSIPVADRVNPPGRFEPELTLQVYPVPEPPVAASCCE